MNEVPQGPSPYTKHQPRATGALLTEATQLATGLAVLVLNTTRHRHNPPRHYHQSHALRCKQRMLHHSLMQPCTTWPHPQTHMPEGPTQAMVNTLHLSYRQRAYKPTQHACAADAVGLFLDKPSQHASAANAVGTMFVQAQSARFGCPLSMFVPPTQWEPSLRDTLSMFLLPMQWEHCSHKPRHHVRATHAVGGSCVDEIPVSSSCCHSAVTPTQLHP
jgi:hypothetical protein